MTSECAVESHVFVFVLGERLEGPAVTAASAMAAVRSVYAGVEVIDSRYIDFKFALPYVVADNASSSRFVVGGVERDPATSISPSKRAYCRWSQSPSMLSNTPTIALCCL